MREFHTDMLRKAKLKPYYALRKGKLAHVPSNGYTGVDMAKAYRMTGLVKGLIPPTVHLVELGGTFDTARINNWCAQRGFPRPSIINTNQAGYTPSPDPNGADVEVGLDICVVIGTVFAMFGTAANINVVNGGNSDSGFEWATGWVADNAKPGDTCGISWGGPENNFDDIPAMEANFKRGSARGITFCCASGDNGPDDGTSAPVTDYPGCSAYAVDCGATTITLNPDGSLKSQTPWNSGGGASGGGLSKIIPKPAWQGFLPGSYRGEPDVVANGDPATGWDTPFGVVGGTSAVAPFMAAFFAGINALLLNAGKSPPGLVNPFMYANEANIFTDITSGSIGSDVPPAATGWDEDSGLGSVIGDIFAKYATGSPAPIPPTPQPPIPQPPAPQPPSSIRPNVEQAFMWAMSDAINWFSKWDLRQAASQIDAALTKRGI